MCQRVFGDILSVMFVFPLDMLLLIHVLRIVDWLRKLDVVCSFLPVGLARTFCFGRGVPLPLSRPLEDVCILVLDFGLSVLCHTNA